MSEYADVVAIAAVARNGVIGDGPRIPWNLPADQARFRQLTLGGVLILGHRTHVSIGRVLPGRTTIVLTREPSWREAGVLVAHDIEAALALAVEVDPEATTWIGGGGEVYRAAMPWTTALELTEVDLAPDGDATFPPVSSDEWVEVSRERQDGYAYVRFHRPPPTPATSKVRRPQAAGVSP